MTTSLEPGALVAPGVPGPALGRLGELPGVNLMPREIAERAAMQRVKILCGAAVALSLVAVGGLYYQAHRGVTTAQQSLTAAQGQQSAEQKKVTALAPVAQKYAQVAAAKAQAAGALSGEVRWSGQLNDLAITITPGVWLTAMNLATGPSTAGSVRSTGIDSISFTGNAQSRDDLAAWLDKLALDRNYTNPYVTSTQETLIGSRRVISFSATVTVTPDSLSGRYTTATIGES